MVAIAAALIFAVFGAAIIRRHREFKEKPTAKENVPVNGAQASVSAAVLIHGTKVISSHLKMIFTESGELVPRNSDGTFTLNDGETYYLFDTGKDFFFVWIHILSFAIVFHKTTLGLKNTDFSLAEADYNKACAPSGPAPGPNAAGE